MNIDGDIAAIRSNLGMRIRTLRTQQHLSQYTFARMVSLDRTYIIGVEKGRRNVSVDNLCKIASGLGVSLSELFEDVDDKESIVRQRALMGEPLDPQPEGTQATAPAAGGNAEPASPAGRTVASPGTPSL